MWAFALLDAANGRPAALARPLRDQAALLSRWPAAPSTSPRRSRPCSRVPGTPGRARRGGGPPLPADRRRGRDRAHLLRGRPQPPRGAQRDGPVGPPGRASRGRSATGRSPRRATTAAASRRPGSSPSCFGDSVRLHARSDVPVGTCLSGGLDSSAIVCVADRLRREGQIPHYAHSGFGYLPEDAGLLRAALHGGGRGEQTGLEMTYVEVAADRFAEALVEVARQQDEPFGSTSIAAQYFVFEAAKAGGMKVMLDGQGADEVLGGYDHYFPLIAVALLRRRRFAGYAALLARATGASGARPPISRRHALATLAPAARRRRGRQPACPSRRPRRCSPSEHARPGHVRGLPLAGVRLGPRAARRPAPPHWACRRCCASRTATRWPTRSRLGCRSWTTAWSSSPSGSPTTTRSTAPSTKDVLRRGTGRRAARARCASARDKIGFRAEPHADLAPRRAPPRRAAGRAHRLRGPLAGSREGIAGSDRRRRSARPRPSSCCGGRST